MIILVWLLSWALSGWVRKDNHTSFPPPGTHRVRKSLQSQNGEKDSIYGLQTCKFHEKSVTYMRVITSPHSGFLVNQSGKPVPLGHVGGCQLWSVEADRFFAQTVVSVCEFSLPRWSPNCDGFLHDPPVLLDSTDDWKSDLDSPMGPCKA